MGFVAIQPLKFGDGWLQPGEPVPVEKGRNYRMMLQRGEIAAVADENDETGPRGRLVRSRAPRASRSEGPGVSETTKSGSSDDE